MGNEIRKLYIEPSTICNLSCSMCFRNLWYNEEKLKMPDDICEKVKGLANIKSIESVVFAGMGEPLTHKRIYEMIRAFSRKGIFTEIITNGTLLTNDVSKKLVGSGLGRLWISMDGFSKQEYDKIRIGSRFELICSNLKQFNTVREGTDTRLGITHVMMKEYVNSLSNINYFADEYSADMLNLSHVIPCEPVDKSDTMYSSDLPVGRMKRFVKPYTKLKQYSCPFVEADAIFARADGDIAPCMQLLHNCYTYLYDEKRRIERQAYGNLLIDDLYEVYSKTEYVEFRKRVEQFHFSNCTGCTTGCFMRESNLEDCMCNEKPTCGGCLWSLGIISCP